MNTKLVGALLATIGMLSGFSILTYGLFAHVGMLPGCLWLSFWVGFFGFRLMDT